MKFISSNFTLEESNVVAFGVPIGRNSVKALQSLRYISQFVEPMDLDSGRNLLENVKSHDIGNIQLTSFDKITEETEKALSTNKIPLILGGNHLLSYYALKAFENVKVIVFDAHGDFKNSYEDEKIKDMDAVDGLAYDKQVNDATWLRRISEVLNPQNTLLLGIRSCDEFEFNDLKKSGIKYFTSKDIKQNQNEVAKFIESFTQGSRTYISVDIDVFDPSIAPAVDMPEPGGIFFNDFQELIASVKGKLVGTDICCINPTPNNEITEFLAIRSLFEILGLINSE